MVNVNNQPIDSGNEMESTRYNELTAGPAKVLYNTAEALLIGFKIRTLLLLSIHTHPLREEDVLPLKRHSGASAALPSS
jgi:hypothetical protein